MAKAIGACERAYLNFFFVVAVPDAPNDLEETLVHDVDANWLGRTLVEVASIVVLYLLESLGKTAEFLVCQAV